MFFRSFPHLILRSLPSHIIPWAQGAPIPRKALSPNQPAARFRVHLKEFTSIGVLGPSSKWLTPPLRTCDEKLSVSIQLNGNLIISSIR